MMTVVLAIKETIILTISLNNNQKVQTLDLKKIIHRSPILIWPQTPAATTILYGITAFLPCISVWKPLCRVMRKRFWESYVVLLTKTSCDNETVGNRVIPYKKINERWSIQREFHLILFVFSIYIYIFYFLII